ncbi:MAG: PilZ domain-containing protein [Candidatus Omnitrophica bacterium]|nr:PilZ domain-containing protein [Candidatus Omnitrophota bacterium]
MLRAYERFQVQGHLSLKVPDTFPAILGDATLDNISFGGFAMNSRQRIEADTVIDFKLKPDPVDAPLVGRGKVRYAKADILNQHNYKIGVEFMQVNKEMLQHLITKLQNMVAEDIKNSQRRKKIEFRDIPF